MGMQLCLLHCLAAASLRGSSGAMLTHRVHPSNQDPPGKLTHMSRRTRKAGTCNTNLTNASLSAASLTISRFTTSNVYNNPPAPD